MSERGETETKLRGLVEAVLPGARGIDPDGSLLEAGIDSVAMVDLLASLEERFGVQVPPEEITQENFASLRSLGELVERLRP